MLAPIYDNGAAFHSKISDKKLLSIYNSPEFTNNSTNIVTAYGINGHLLSAKKFLKFFENEPLFNQSIQRIVPLINEKFNDIKDMISEIPEKAILENKEVIEIVSETRKKIYIAQMEKRYEKLLLPEYEYLFSIERNGLLSEINHLNRIADKIADAIDNGEIGKEQEQTLPGRSK